MKRLARGEEAVVAIPAVVGIVPVQVQVTLGTIPVQISHVPVAVRVLPTRTHFILCRVSSLTPPFEYSPG